MLVCLYLLTKKKIPVIGASTSNRFGSCFNISVPLLIMYKACSSEILPSRIKWFFKNAISGFSGSSFEKKSSDVGKWTAGAWTSDFINKDIILMRISKLIKSSKRV